MDLCYLNWIQLLLEILMSDKYVYYSTTHIYKYLTLVNIYLYVPLEKISK